MTSSNIVPYIPKEGPLDLVAVRMDSRQFPRIKAYPATLAVPGIVKIITGALVYTGRTPVSADVERMAAALLAELLQDHDGVGTANITLDELNYCVRRAVLGLGPEMYGINVASLYKVACDYCLNEGREAQESANARHATQRRAALKAAPVGAMMQTYAGATLLNTTLNPTKK